MALACGLPALGAQPASGEADADAPPALPTVEVKAARDTLTDTPTPGALAPVPALGENDLVNEPRMDGALVDAGLAQWDAANSLGIGQGLNLRGFSLSNQNTTQLQASRAVLNGHADLAWRFVREPATVQSVRLLGGADATLLGAGSPGGTLQIETKAPMGVSATRLDLRLVSNGTRRLVLDTERALGPLQVRGVTVLHGGDRTEDGLTDRHQAALLSTRLPYGDANQPSHVQLDLEYHRNRLPYAFGAPYEAGRFWLEHDYVDAAHARADRRYTRQALYWRHRFGEALTLSAHAQRGRSTRDEVLPGFFTLLDAQHLMGYYRELSERNRQLDAGLRLDGQWRTGAAQHRWALAWQGHRQARDFSGPQNIGGFTLALDNPVFPAHPELLPLTPRHHFQRYREQGLGAAWQTQWNGWDWRVGMRQARLALDGGNTPGQALQAAARAKPLTHALALGRELGQTQRVWLSRTQSFMPNRGQLASGAWLPASRSVQWEAGWAWRAEAAQNDAPATRQPRPELSVTAFDIRQGNLPAVDPNDRDYYVLRGHVRSRGLELRGQASTGVLDWTVALNLLRARVDPGDGGPLEYLPGVAQRFGMVQVSAPVAPHTRGWVRVLGTARRPGDELATFHAPGHGLVSMGLEHTFQSNPAAAYTLGLRIDNLTNRRYVRALTGADNVWQGDGRRVSLWLTALF
ncbi:MAG: hypothetical protein Q4G70_02695 [Pseudomonadota bacterium]|nr:hypothetical protein [Pseudomonadota bacterium]